MCASQPQNDGSSPSTDTTPTPNPLIDTLFGLICTQQLINVQIYGALIAMHGRDRTGFTDNMDELASTIDMTLTHMLDLLDIDDETLALFDAFINHKGHNA